MLVIASDLHMTDRATGAPVSDLELAAFAREVAALEPLAEPLTLVLLGDVIDFLRSEEWGRLWDEKNGAAPWSSVGPDFRGFEGSYQATRLAAIATRVVARYPEFSRALERLKQRAGSRIVYVVGNHDFMVQLSRETRAQIVRFLSLDHDAEDPFPLEHDDPELSVFAEHGHRHDPTNWHQVRAGNWAIGDAIVLRVVNRFGDLARQRLRLADDTRLGRAVNEIDNVEPHLEIPLYVVWLARTELVSDSERDALLDCWRTCVREFLDLPDFREERYGKAAAAIRWLRELYALVDLERLLEYFKKIPDELSHNYSRQAHLTITDRIVRVFGHTHEPGVWALPEEGGRRRFYVNTGTWRRVIRRVQVEPDAVDFAGSRVGSFLIVRGPGDFELRSRCRHP
jgi:UDP-2,3-diacylglucosamine pyrophosphatase LpxH